MKTPFEIIAATALLVIVAAIWLIIARRRRQPAAPPATTPVAVDPGQQVPTPAAVPIQLPGTGLTYHVRRWEDHIIVLSGPALATSGIIAGLDILTNSIIKTNAPIVGDVMGVVWAVCLMLTLDFQILTLGVRVQKIAASPTDKTSKFWSILLCIVLGLALSYVSLQMGAIFAKMLSDSKLTLDSAQIALGINANALIYERSGMVMLLIFLSGFLRDLDAGQMLVLQPNSVVASPATSGIPQPAQQTDLAETLKTIAQMNADTLKAMQESNRETIQIAINQINTVSVTLVNETVSKVTEIIAAQVGVPQIAQQAEPADVLLVHPETVLNELVARVPVLASVDKEDALKVIMLHLEGMTRTRIQKELGWGSTKYSNVIKPIVDELASGNPPLTEPADDVTCIVQ